MAPEDVKMPQRSVDIQSAGISIGTFRAFSRVVFASLYVVISVVAALSLTIFAVFAQANIYSAAELGEFLSRPTVGVKAVSLQVVGVGPDVTVLAQKEKADNDRDLKIDAIFLAKALVLGAPGQVNRVKVLFSQAGQDGRYVTITDKQITQYGSGKMSADQLLSTLHLVPVAPDRAPDVVAGPQYERRLLVWERIEKLRRSGTSVEPFEALFSEVEKNIASGASKEDPGKKLTFLENKLSDQEAALQQAKRTARGLGVPALKTSASTGGATNVSAAAAAASPSNPQNSSAASAGAKDGQSSASSAIPQEHQRWRLIFKERAESYINIARGKDYKVAEQMVALKRQIESAFAGEHLVQGFVLMRQFQGLVKQTNNVDMFANSADNGGPENTPTGGPFGGGGPSGGGPPGRD